MNEVIGDMATLTEPSKELAARLLSEVDWDDRIMGHSIHPSGTAAYAFLSVEQIAGFIGKSSLETTHMDLMLPGGDFTVCYIKPEALREWVEVVLGDPELAAAIGDCIEATTAMADEGDGVPYPLLMQPVKVLLDERVEQARALLNEVA